MDMYINISHLCTVNEVWFNNGSLFNFQISPLLLFNLQLLFLISFLFLLFFFSSSSSNSLADSSTSSAGSLLEFVSHGEVNEEVDAGIDSQSKMGETKEDLKPLWGG